VGSSWASILNSRTRHQQPCIRAQDKTAGSHTRTRTATCKAIPVRPPARMSSRNAQPHSSWGATSCTGDRQSAPPAPHLALLLEACLHRATSQGLHMPTRPCCNSWHCLQPWRQHSCLVPEMVGMLEMMSLIPALGSLGLVSSSSSSSGPSSASSTFSAPSLDARLLVLCHRLAVLGSVSDVSVLVPAGGCHS
jgi:hypothetical protein